MEIKKESVLAGFLMATGYGLVFVAALLSDPPWSGKLMAGMAPTLVTAPTSFVLIIAARVSASNATATLALAAAIQAGIAFLVGAGLGSLMARR